MQKSYKLILVTFLIIFPATLMLGNFIIGVRGDNYIPEEHENNEWHWEVNVGDKLYYEGEFILTNASTGEVEKMYKDLWIYNITSIENVTLDWMGVHNFSLIKAAQCYYNVTSDELEPYESPTEFALFGYNNSDPIKHRISAGYNAIPFVLPLNGSENVQVDILTPIINETFYEPLTDIGYNKFDYYEYDTNTNRIYFSNSSDHFFTEAYYYDNGTLNSGKAYLMAQIGGGPVLINATLKRVFNYNITDEIAWSVNVGDELFYDGIQDERHIDDSMEIKINITGFADVLFNKTKNAFGDEDLVYMVYEAVIADIYVWNGTDYEMMSPDLPIGLANNFYPQYFDAMGPSPYNFLYPTNFAREDFEFLWNNDTLRIWNLPFDLIQYYENSVLEVVLQNSTGLGYVKSVVEKSTGIVQSMLQYDEYGSMFFQIKGQTLVDWSVDIGSVFYYKSNEENLYDMRTTISATNAVFINMTWLVQDFSYYGITLVIPPGQPELQFFSYLDAYLEIWDSDTESWIYVGEQIISVANIYWPISPVMIELGRPPIIIPEGITSTDLSYFFDLYGSIYDSIIYSTGHVVMRNSTIDREIHYYYDEPSGKVTMMHGWGSLPGSFSGWHYISYYPKFYQALTSGFNSFSMSTHFPTGLNVDIELTTTDTGASYIANFFPMNPVNVSLPLGVPFAYFDQLITNYSLISGNITMTITLPPSIILSSVVFLFYAYNMSGTNQWDAAPDSFYKFSVTYNYIANSITIEMPADAFANGIISAMAYISEEFPPEIPGYDLFLISLFIVVISSITIKIRQKKIKKI